MALRIKGITGDITTCEKCGKRNLKRTVILEDTMNAGGEEVYYGSDCAAMALLGGKTKSNSDMITLRAQALQSARRWISAGHSVDTIIKGMTRYGFGIEHRPEINSIRIWGVGEIIGHHKNGYPIFNTVDLSLS